MKVFPWKYFYNKNVYDISIGGQLLKWAYTTFLVLEWCEGME